MVGLLVLSGCTLVDQTTFAPAPEATPVAAAPVAPIASVQVDPRVPLIVIDYAAPTPRYQELLRFAVRAAEARSRGVQYDIVAVLPDAKNAAEGQTKALVIMHDMMAERVPAARLHLALRAEPALTASQIRIYVR